MAITPKKLAVALIALAAAGCVSVVVGVTMIYPPAGMIVGGLIAAGLALVALLEVDV
jgi:hypothetical protein